MAKAGIGLGDVIAVPLEDGRFGAAHVIAVDGRSVGVVMAGTIGKKPNALEDVTLKPYLQEPSMQAGRLDGPPTTARSWVSTPLPRGYVVLGNVAPGAREKKLDIDTWAGGWQSVASTILIQYLRAHEPRKAAALLKKWENQRNESAERHAKKEKERVKALTLEKLIKSRPLASWTKRFSAKVVTEARAILRDTAREISETTGRDRMKALQRGVERFNSLDGKNGLQILTLEREDLCIAFADIASAAKMKVSADPTEKWRDW
jgi:hypothetical protein